MCVGVFVRKKKKETKKQRENVSIKRDGKAVICIYREIQGNNEKGRRLRREISV